MRPACATASLPPAPALSRGTSPALLLACGNSLRQDDGVGLRIAEAAEELVPASRLRIVAAQQFTPEMAAELAATELAIFVDASANDEPGAIRVEAVVPRAKTVETHRLDPPALLAMAQSLCGHAPARAFAVTIGASHFGYGERLSGPLRGAVPRAVRLVTHLVAAFTAHA
jgi:hydrogenase maturation protease